MWYVNPQSQEVCFAAHNFWPEALGHVTSFLLTPSEHRAETTVHHVVTCPESCSLFRCCSEDISWLFNNSFISQMLFPDRPKCKDYFLMERNMFYGCSVVMPWAVLLFLCVCVCYALSTYQDYMFIVFSFLSVIFSHRAFAKPVSVNKEVFYNATRCHSQ